jgi:hypothetical protein
VHKIIIKFTGFPYNIVNCNILLAILKEADVTSNSCETETAGITIFRNLWLENYRNLKKRIMSKQIRVFNNTREVIDAVQYKLSWIKT